MTDYGGIEVTQTWVGQSDRIEILRAPNRAAFSHAMLEMADPRKIRFSPSENTITINGIWAATGEPAELVYRIVDFDQGGRVILCELVRTAQEAE